MRGLESSGGSARAAKWAKQVGGKNRPPEPVIEPIEIGRAMGAAVADVPALVTRKSRRPSALMALRTMSSAAPASDTSPGAATTS